MNCTVLFYLYAEIAPADFYTQLYFGCTTCLNAYFKYVSEPNARFSERPFLMQMALDEKNRLLIPSILHITFV